MVRQPDHGRDAVQENVAGEWRMYMYFITGVVSHHVEHMAQSIYMQGF
jgi:hypothetical protein